MDQAGGGRDRHVGGDILEEDREFVAAQPRDAVAGPDRAVQALTDDLEQRVAGGMPEAVVDGLELVEIEEEDRGIDAGPGASGERMRQPVSEQRPVGKSGQWILERQTAELLLEGLAVGDIDEEAVRQHRVRVRGGDEAGLLTDPDDVPVGVDDPVFLFDGFATRVTLDVEAEDLRLVVGVDQPRVQVRVREEGLDGVTGEFDHLGADVHDLDEAAVTPTVAIEVHRGREPGEERRQVFFRLDQAHRGAVLVVRLVANAEAVRLEDRRSEDEPDRREPGDGCIGEHVGHEERQAEGHQGHGERVTNARGHDRADREATDPSTGATGRRGVGRQRPRVFHAGSMAATIRGLYGPIVRAANRRRGPGATLGGRRSGGTADAADLNSAARKGVRVRISAPAPRT